MADGHLNKCIECVKTRVGKHRESNLESIQAYDRERGRKEHRKARVRENSRTKYNKLRDPDHIKKFPEKYKARVMVSNAVRDGRLTKMNCVECSNPEVQAHHEDYSKPLDVVWLCVDCHMKRHRKYK